jgi:hypothetical protein
MLHLWSEDSIIDPSDQLTIAYSNPQWNHWAMGEEGMANAREASDNVTRGEPFNRAVRK